METQSYTTCRDATPGLCVKLFFGKEMTDKTGAANGVLTHTNRFHSAISPLGSLA